METAPSDRPASPIEVEMASLVTLYATPLAVFLVILGLIFARPSGRIKELSFGLLVFGLLFNLSLARFLKTYRGNARRLIRLRLFTNLVVNILLVFFLGKYWTPVWLLLVLMPLATAIYESLDKTIAASVSVSFILLTIRILQHPAKPLEWGEHLAYAAFIIMLSLLVHGLSAAARRDHGRPSP